MGTGWFEGRDQLCNPVGIRSGQDFPAGARDVREPRELDEDDARFPEQVRLAAYATGVGQDLVRSGSQPKEIDVAHRLAQLDPGCGEQVGEPRLLWVSGRSRVRGTHHAT